MPKFYLNQKNFCVDRWRYRCPDIATVTGSKGNVKGQGVIAVNGTPVSQLWDVTCHMGSHSVTCHPTQVNATITVTAIVTDTAPDTDTTTSQFNINKYLYKLHYTEEAYQISATSGFNIV